MVTRKLEPCRKSGYHLSLKHSQRTLSGLAAINTLKLHPTGQGHCEQTNRLQVVIAPSVPSSSSQTGTGIFAAKGLKGPSRWMHYHFKLCSRIDRDFEFDSHLHYKDFSHCKTVVPVIFGCHHQPSLVRLLPSTSEGSPRGWLELSDGDGVAALETVQCMCAYLYIYISINYWYIYICI